MATPDDIQVDHAHDAGRYEIRVAGELAGFAAYERRDGLVELTHTVVDPTFEGRGLGSRLIVAALEDVRTSGLSVLPTCSFVARFLERHPEYSDLVSV